MGDTSLIFSIIARDKATATLKKLEAQSASVGKSIAMALGPAIGPIMAVGTVGVASLGTALAGAGLAAGVFGGVAKSAMTEVSQNATKFSDLTDKMALYGRMAKIAAASGQDNSKYLDKQAEAALELKARLANLPPDTRAATSAFLDMKQGWGAFVDNNKPATFNIMASGYKLISSAISQLQPFFDMGARGARSLVAAITPFITGGGIERFAATAGPALDTLINIIINVGTALGRTFGKIGSGEGQGILDFIDRATAKWAAWAGTTNQKTGLDHFIAYAQQNGPRVIGLLGNLATAAMHIAQATSPIAPISLAIASALARMVAAIPQPWLTAIIAGFIAFNLAMKAYSLGMTIAKVVTWAMNSALLASPITWIVLAVVALVAVIVLLATKTRFFQTIWAAVWGFLKTVGAWFAGPFANFFVVWYQKVVASLGRAKNQVMSVAHAIGGFFTNMGHGIASAWDAVVRKTTSVINWFRAAPGKLRSSLSSMFSGLASGFRGYVNQIIGAWNRLQFTIGGGTFMGISIPSFSVGTPNIPYMATGGKIRSDGLIFAHAGEEITKRAQVTRTGPGTGSGGGTGGATLTIKSDGGKVGRFMLEILREAIRDKGGDVVKVLSPV